MKNIKSLTPAMMMLTAPIVFTACQNDDLDSSTSNAASNNVAIADDNGEEYKFEEFAYGNGGPTSISQQVATIDLGYNNGVASRSGVVETAFSEATKLIEWGDLITGTLKSKAGSEAFSDIKNLLMKSEETKDLMAINSRLNVAVNLAKDLNDKACVQELSKLMRERLDQCEALECWNGDMFKQVFSNINNPAMFESLLKKWANMTVSDGPAYTATKTYLNFLTNGYNSQQKSMPEIYDEWVYNSTPWEHMGYDNRDNLRLADVSLASTSYILTAAYLLLTDQMSELDNLSTAYDNFKKIYKEHAKVERHDDVLICQIKGAHIKFNKALIDRDMYGQPWNKLAYSETSFAGYTGYGEDGVYYKTAMNASLSPAEAKAIFAYYNDGKSDKKTFDEILKMAGFDTKVLNSGKAHIMTLNTELDTHWSLVGTKSTYEINLKDVVKSDTECDKSDNVITKNYVVGVANVNGKSDGRGSKKFCSFIDWKKYNANNVQFFRTDIVERIK